MGCSRIPGISPLTEASELFKVGGYAPGLVEEGQDRYYAFSDGPHIVTRRGK